MSGKSLARFAGKYSIKDGGDGTVGKKPTLIRVLRVEFHILLLRTHPVKFKL